MSTTPSHEKHQEPTDHEASTSANRPFSIDFSLELEHQLNNESEPPTPAHDAVMSDKGAQEESKHESLDPHILASIVMQLRNNLSEVAKERDDLVKLLASANSNEASLKDSLEHITEKCTTMEEELHEARNKAKEDEEAISMLRSKVEESRRGLMRLQTESRRSSVVPNPIDVSRTVIPSLTSSKRQSFTPLPLSTGSGRPPNLHRRTSSHSDSALSLPHPDLQLTSPSPNGQVLFFDSASINSATHPPSSARRFSGIFGRPSSQQNDLSQQAYDPVAAELDGLRRELRSAKDELLEIKHELTEAREGKEASEQCVTALRDFIAENNVGVAKPPLLATVSSPATTATGTVKKGWGFNLWKTDPADKSEAGTSSPASVPVATPRSSEDAGTPSIRKLTGLFSSRASISSTASSSLPALQSTTSDSDSSSLNELASEPASPPTKHLDGTGLIVASPDSEVILKGSPEGLKSGALNERMESVVLP